MPRSSAAGHAKQTNEKVDDIFAFGPLFIELPEGLDATLVIPEKDVTLDHDLLTKPKGFESLLAQKKREFRLCCGGTGW